MLCMLSMSGISQATEVTCDQVLRACDEALLARDNQLKLMDKALNDATQQILSLDKAVKEADDKLSSPTRNPFVYLTAGAIGGALVAPLPPLGLSILGVTTLVGLIFGH